MKITVLGSGNIGGTLGRNWAKAGQFEDPRFGRTETDLFYCGPDGKARPVVEALIKEVGLRPVWVGDLDQVQLVDAVGSLWVTLAFRRGMGRRLAFKLLTG